MDDVCTVCSGKIPAHKEEAALDALVREDAQLIEVCFFLRREKFVFDRITLTSRAHPGSLVLSHDCAGCSYLCGQAWRKGQTELNDSYFIAAIMCL